jgi:hypothetical protein
MTYFESRGYQLLDKWHVPEINIEIPFHPGQGLTGLEGLYFARAS